MKKISAKFLRLALSCGIGMNLIPSVQLFAQTEEPSVLDVQNEENEDEKENEGKKSGKPQNVPASENEDEGAKETKDASTQRNEGKESSADMSGQETKSEDSASQEETSGSKSDEPIPSTDEGDGSLTDQEGEDGKEANPEEEEKTDTETKPETPEQKPEESATPSQTTKPEEEKQPEVETKPVETVKPSQSQSQTVSQTNAPAKTELSIKTETKTEETKVEATINYKTSSWTQPSTVAAKGYAGDLKKSLKLDDFKTSNLTDFLGNGNPFMVGQCTWFAWARFYQVYGFDSGARGNGKTNAAEIVRAHSNKFELSSTPAAGATFSVEQNTLMPQYGHVGFIEAFDGEYMWISEGNVMFNGVGGNIWVHKVRWADYKKAYPDIVFAIPKKGVFNLEEEKETQPKEERFVIKKHTKKTLSRVEKNAPKYSTLGSAFHVEK